MFDFLIDFFVGIAGALDYWGVFFLMAIESSFIPFPSEIVVPPAAYAASQGEMTLWGVILCGTLGSVIGALVNYFLALTLGREIVYRLLNTRLAKIFLLNEAKVKKAEDYFEKRGAVATFLGRLIPAVRQLVSIPAGFVRMNLIIFSAFTALGAGLWVTVLALLGYYWGPKVVELEGFHLVKLVLLGVFALFLLWLGLKIWFKRKSVKSI